MRRFAPPPQSGLARCLRFCVALLHPIHLPNKAGEATLRAAAAERPDAPSAPRVALLSHLSHLLSIHEASLVTFLIWQVMRSFVPLPQSGLTRVGALA
jgi:hypothetical protein